jgi:Zn-finger nucleic acid-binding protein
MLSAARSEERALRLVACQSCRVQYDVSDVLADSFPCRCGETVANRSLEAVDAQIHRCGACGALVGADAGSCEYCGSRIERDRRALSLICPECYARTAEDSRFCMVCGVAFRPEKVEFEGFELPCPLCGGLMPVTQVGGVPINECSGCHGLWVPGENFDLLVARAIEARRSADPIELALRKPRVTGANPAVQPVEYRKCPVCDGFMQRRNFRKSSGVIIDSCRQHGTWLDADELEQIAGFILSGGQTAISLSEPTRPSRHEARAAASFESAWSERAGLGRSGAGEGLVDSLVGLLSRLVR